MLLPEFVFWEFSAQKQVLMRNMQQQQTILLSLCTVLPSSDVPPPTHYHPSQSHSHLGAAHLHARSANPWSRPREPFPKPQCCLPVPPLFSGAKETRWVLRPGPSHPRSWKGPTCAMLQLLTARATVPTFTCSLSLTLLLEKVSSHHDWPPQGRGLETLLVWSRHRVCRTSPTLSTTRDCLQGWHRAASTKLQREGRKKKILKKKKLWASAYWNLQTSYSIGWKQHTARDGTWTEIVTLL